MPLELADEVQARDRGDDDGPGAAPGRAEERARGGDRDAEGRGRRRPTTCSARAPTHLVRDPYTTGLMVSTIDRPQGPQSADHPATAAAIARTTPGPISTFS